MATKTGLEKKIDQQDEENRQKYSPLGRKARLAARLPAYDAQANINKLQKR
jgi:hypothetical protein